MARKKISRRGVVAGFGAAAGGMVGGTSGSRASPATRLSLTGHVAWCNSEMGVMKFEPDRDDAGGCMVYLNAAVVGERTLRRLLPPCSTITVNLVWRPDLNILAPWLPVEVISATGEHVPAFASRQGS